MQSVNSYERVGQYAQHGDGHSKGGELEKKGKTSETSATMANKLARTSFGKIRTTLLTTMRRRRMVMRMMAVVIRFVLVIELSTDIIKLRKQATGQRTDRELRNNEFVHSVAFYLR